MTIEKLQGIEFTRSELDNYYNTNRIFVIKYRTVYQLFYTTNYNGYYLTPIYYKQKMDKYDLPLTKRGRFVVFNAKETNRLLGFDLVRD